MRIKLIVIALCTLLAGALGLYWWGMFSREPIPEHLQNMGGNFTLQSADGPVALQDFRGELVLIYFGYANCPDACPMTLSNWAKAFEKLTPGARERVNGMLVSVDPARDSLDSLKQYTAYFHPNIVGLTGGEAELRKIADLYRSDFVIEREEGSEDYHVAHMSFVYVIDPQGELRALLAHESPVEEIVKTIRHVLRVAG